MAYVDDFSLTTDSTFQGRVRMAMIKAAIAIGNAAPSVNAVVDGKRNALVLAVLTFPDRYVSVFTQAAIEAGPLSSSSTDASIDTAIASVWGEIAGVTTRD